MHIDQRKRLVTLMNIAQLAYAHWFFGNLYEAVVRVPDRLATDFEPGGQDRRMTSVLSAGSPVRYYLPGVPVVIGATVAALVGGWTSRRDRLLLSATALCALSGIAATAYLVRTINVKLFVAGHALTSVDQRRLLQLWYRINLVRLLLAGCAWLIAARVSAR